MKQSSYHEVIKEFLRKAGTMAQDNPEVPSDLVVGFVQAYGRKPSLVLQAAMAILSIMSGHRIGCILKRVQR